MIGATLFRQSHIVPVKNVISNEDFSTLLSSVIRVDSLTLTNMHYLIWSPSVKIVRLR